MKEEYKLYEERLRSHDRLLHEALKLRESHQLPMSDDLEDDIMRCITPKRRRVFWLYPTAAVAAAIIIGVLILPHLLNNEDAQGNVATMTVITNKADKVAQLSQPKAKITTHINTSRYRKTEKEAVNNRRETSRKEIDAIKARALQPEKQVQERHLADAEYNIVSNQLYDSEHPQVQQLTSCAADPETMFIETAPDNNILSANRDRMTAEMIINASY